MMSPRMYQDLAWVWPFISPPEDYVEEVEAFRLLLGRRGVRDGATLLHLGSGGGSIDWHFKRIYQVTGLDRSQAMLEYARGINPEVEYLEGDMRDADLGRLFDVVLLHDACAYLTTPAEISAAYHTVARHLRPGGVLLMLPEQLRSRFQQHGSDVSTRTRGDVSVTTVEVAFDPDPTDHSFEQTYVFLIREAGRLSVEVDTHLIGIFDLDELLTLLRGAGLEGEVTHADLGPIPEEQNYPLITAVKR